MNFLRNFKAVITLMVTYSLAASVWEVMLRSSDTHPDGFPLCFINEWFLSDRWLYPKLLLNIRHLAE